MASGECWQLFSDLSCYTVAKQDEEFIHQYVVDTYEAQHAGGKTRNIRLPSVYRACTLRGRKGIYGKAGAAGSMQIVRVGKTGPGWSLRPAGKS